MQKKDNNHFQSANNLNRLSSMEKIPTETDFRCRICLDKDPGVLVKLPCACVGEVGIIHQECFERWIYTLRNQPFFHARANSINSNESNVFEIPCEICTHNIRFRVDQKIAMISCQTKSPASVIFTAFRICLVVVLIVVTAYIFGGGIARNNNVIQISINVVILLIVEIVLLFVLKLEVQGLFEKQLTNLSIIDAKPVEQEEHIEFDIESQQTNEKKQERPIQTSDQIKSNQSVSRRRRRKNRSNPIQH